VSIGRRDLLKRAGALVLFLSRPLGGSQTASAEAASRSHVGAGPHRTPTACGEDVEYLDVPLDKVPHPRAIRFKVRHRGRDPITLVGHYWYNREALEAGRRMPAILEFSPYRRRDGMMYVDSMMYPWFALNEYLCFRVDVEGSGDSEGTITDEYTPEELDYCAQVVEQIAKLPICDGNVGMMGKSWSAINSLMLSARDDMPDALKAVVVCCGTDDRFNDDIHYMGGAMMMDNFGWPSSMWGWLPLPPDPVIVPKRWRQLWRQRIRNMTFWFRQWASHQTRDDYWRRTNVRDRYDKVKVPVFILSGWQDGYKNPVERVVRHLGDRGRPVAGLLGPWGHKYPFDGYPGPRIDWLRYVTTHWWDRWLKGKTPDAATEWPQFVVWMGESREPPRDRKPSYTDKGQWIAEDHNWPRRAREHVFHLSPGRRLTTDRPDERRTYEATPDVSMGLTMLETSSWGECSQDDLPGNQERDDAHALTFDSPPLPDDLPAFGYPRVRLALTSDRPLGSVALRLSEVSPKTGHVHLVTYRFFNLAYREGDAAFNGDMDRPKPVRPGRRFTLTVPLNLIGHVFKAGWRLRLEVSPVFFPTMWQSASPPTLRVHVGPSEVGAPSALMISRRPTRAEDAHIQNLLARPITTYVNPEQYVPTVKTNRKASHTRTAKRIVVNERRGTLVRKVFDSGSYVYGGALDNLLVDETASENFRVLDGDSLSAIGFTRYDSTLARGGWKVRAVTHSRVWSERTWRAEPVFRYEARVQTYLNGRRFESKRIRGTIPRRWV
jgi:uncharacterized protein